MHKISRLERHILLFGMCFWFGSISERMAFLGPPINRVNKSCNSKDINYVLPEQQR